MTTLHEEPGLVGSPGGGDSLIDRLRRKRRDLASQQTIDIPIAGYGGDLVARYRLLDPLVEGKELAHRISEQFPKQPTEQTYFGLVDLLIAACVGLYARSQGELLPIDDEDGLGAMTYSDGRIAEFLRFEASTARDAVLGVFAGNKNAVIAHGLLLNRWLSDTSGELDERTLGAN